MGAETTKEPLGSFVVGAVLDLAGCCFFVFEPDPVNHFAVRLVARDQVFEQLANGRHVQVK
jgi:hypothetical protein